MNNIENINSQYLVENSEVVQIALRKSILQLADEKGIKVDSDFETNMENWVEDFEILH
jgi:hypothetical protein